MDITWYNMKLTIVLYWLVVWNMTYSIFPFSWECHHPNWLSHFSEGLKPPTSHVLFEIYKFTVSLIFRPIHILTYPRTLHDLGHLISAWPRFQGLPRGGTLQLRMEQWDEFSNSMQKSEAGSAGSAGRRNLVRNRCHQTWQWMQWTSPTWDLNEEIINGGFSIVMFDYRSLSQAAAIGKGCFTYSGGHSG